MNNKLISIVTPTYNEVDNIGELLKRLHEVTANLEGYDFEFVVIDNCSTDGTQELLKDLAAKDLRLKVIFNARNFGHIRSPYYGILQSIGWHTSECEFEIVNRNICYSFPEKYNSSAGCSQYDLFYNPYICNSRDQFVE
jgi:cellulose synthase/poly-beta-1,6-N-acetylglucosamine synthase-like glycosyltransferase